MMQGCVVDLSVCDFGAGSGMQKRRKLLAGKARYSVKAEHTSSLAMFWSPESKCVTHKAAAKSPLAKETSAHAAGRFTVPTRIKCVSSQVSNLYLLYRRCRSSCILYFRMFHPPNASQIGTAIKHANAGIGTTRAEFPS